MAEGIVTLKERHRRKMHRMERALVAIDALRGSRHVAAQADERFDEDRAALASPEAETFLAGIGPALARFRAAVDPD